MTGPALQHDYGPDEPPRLSIVQPVAPPDDRSVRRSPLSLVSAFLLGVLVAGAAFAAGAASTSSWRTATLPEGSAGAAPHVAGAPYRSVADLTEAVQPAVVIIAAHTATADPRHGIITEDGAGSGVIFDPRGYILTNKHVVEGAQQLRVTLADGRRFRDVQIVGVDHDTDLAVLKVDTGGGPLPAVPFGDSDRLRPGETVVAMGNALGRGETVVSVGVVAALERTITTSDGQMLHELVQTDAAINPGNSGGPLLNLAGEIVGITTAMDTRAQGISFAVGSAAARPVAEQIVASGTIIRPWMGVVVDAISPAVMADYGLPTQDGLFVIGVARGGPAARAGLRPGDVIIRVGDQPVKRVRTFLEWLRSHRAGEVVEIVVLRPDGEARLAVPLELEPAEGARP